MGAPRPFHSRTHLDYAVAKSSKIVSEGGYQGSFDVTKIGLLPSFTHDLSAFKRRDAYGIMQAERYDRACDLWTFVGPSSGGGVQAGGGLGSGTVSADRPPAHGQLSTAAYHACGAPLIDVLISQGIHFQRDPAYSVPPGSWARFDGVDFGAGGKPLAVQARALGQHGGARVLFKLRSPDASGVILAELNVSALPGVGREPGTAQFKLMRGAAGDFPAPQGVHPVFMVFEALAPAPPPAPGPSDDKPHRYWRLLAGMADFNQTIRSNHHWDVCSLRLFGSGSSGRNLATVPANGFSSHGSAASVFSGAGDNCTQWDGRGGGNSKILNFGRGGGFVGYDFGAGKPQNIKSVRLKQFPNQYCAATPALQFSDDKTVWTTTWRLECGGACPNNATAAQSQDPSSWTLSPTTPGSVAPPGPPASAGIGALIDFFRFTEAASPSKLKAGVKSDDGTAAVASPVLLSVSPAAAPIEGGAMLVATLSELCRSSISCFALWSKNASCNIGWRMDSWSFPARSWPATVNGKQLQCGPMPALPAEGPVDFFISAAGTSSNKIMLATYATFSASIGMTPYFNAAHGELLYKVNDTAGLIKPPYSISATTADGKHQLLKAVAVTGVDTKLAVPISFAALNASGDWWLNVTLSAGALPHAKFTLQVRLLRHSTQGELLPPFAVAIDHSSRGLLVGGQPFFPMSWVSLRALSASLRCSCC